MKFEVLSDVLKVEGGPFYKGDKRDTDICGVPESSVERWYRAGFVQIEDRETAPNRDKNHTEIEVQNSKVINKSAEVK